MRRYKCYNYYHCQRIFVRSCDRQTLPSPTDPPPPLTHPTYQQTSNFIRYPPHTYTFTPPPLTHPTHTHSKAPTTNLKPDQYHNSKHPTSSDKTAVHQIMPLLHIDPQNTLIPVNM